MCPSFLGNWRRRNKNRFFLKSQKQAIFFVGKYMMLGYLQRAGPGKATPRQGLAARQPGNSWPLRLYPDVMRRYSPLLCCAMVLGKYKNTNMQTQISNKCNDQYFPLFAFFPICLFTFWPRWSLHFARCVNTSVWESSNLSCRSLVTS